MQNLLAEGRRFELLVPLRVRQFSKLVVSATHPTFLTVFLHRVCSPIALQI